MTLDKAKVIHAARNSVPLVIKTHRLPAQTEADLEEILLLYLNVLGQAELKDHLTYCLRELTVNSKKANTKRVYFKEMGLDLSNPAEYEKGIKTFKKDTLDNIDHYLELQEKEDLYIKVTFLIRNNVLYMTVKNNVPIMPKELTRVYDRITRSKAFDSMEEAFSEVLDDSEGAGLGIVIMILMLRKMGLNEKAFNLVSSDNETTAGLTIPINSVKLEKINMLADEIIKTIDTLPPFPDNLQKLIDLLSNPDVSFEVLAKQLTLDPAMTADLIRYVNSAKYGVRKKIDTIPEAIRIVGIQGIKDLIYPYGAHKLLDKYLEKQKSLWQDALKVSFYAAEIAKALKLPREDQSQVQIGGILYNIGQIILSYLQPEVSSRIQDFCKTRNLSSEVFEELTSSMNPYDIGARIAEKWNFPDDLVQMIRHHNHPQYAVAAIQPLVCIVNVASSLLAVEQELITYSQINLKIVMALKLDPQRLEELHGKLKELYARTSESF